MHRGQPVPVQLGITAAVSTTDRMHGLRDEPPDETSILLTTRVLCMTSGAIYLMGAACA